MQTLFLVFQLFCNDSSFPVSCEIDYKQCVAIKYYDLNTIHDEQFQSDVFNSCYEDESLNFRYFRK